MYIPKNYPYSTSDRPPINIEDYVCGNRKPFDTSHLTINLYVH